MTPTMTTEQIEMLPRKNHVNNVSTSELELTHQEPEEEREEQETTRAAGRAA